MNFQPSITLGICVFTVLILTGGAFYSYSTEVTYPVQTPILQYRQEQRSRYIGVFDELVIQNTINPHERLDSDWYDATTSQLDTIAFTLEGTDQTSFAIRGLVNGIIWGNWSVDYGIKYISVWSNDSYRIEIYNPSSSSPVYVSGRIDFFRTEHYWENVPYYTYETTYQTYTDYPHRGLGTILIFLGVVVGIGTVVSIFINRRSVRFL